MSGSIISMPLEEDVGMVTLNFVLSPFRNTEILPPSFITTVVVSAESEAGE